MAVDEVPSRRRASARVKSTLASFEVPYTKKPARFAVGVVERSSLPTRCAPLDVDTTRAPGVSRRSSSSSVVSRKCARWFTAKVSS